MYFKYGKKEMDYLKSRDSILGKYIEEIGIIEREVEPDLFKALVFQIIGQQISNKVYMTIKGRFIETIKVITPKNIIDTEDEVLLNCGISKNKVKYIKNIANFAIENKDKFDNLYNTDEETFYNTLIEIKGVGKWTIQMSSIFCLQKPDILSYKDLIVRKSLMKIHNLTSLNEQDFEYYKNLYSPYGTIASFYLWSIK